MNQLVTFPIDLSRTATALESIGVLLSRIADAMDRLAPPLTQPAHDYQPIQTQLNELRNPTPERVASVQREFEDFAARQNVMPGSDAFYQAVGEFEAEVEAVYGEEAIKELPWNKIAGGPIFKKQSSTDPKQTAGEQERPQAGDQTGTDIQGSSSRDKKAQR